MGAHDIIVLGASAGGIEAFEPVALPPALESPGVGFCGRAHPRARHERAAPDLQPARSSTRRTRDRLRGRSVLARFMWLPPDHHLLVQFGRVVLVAVVRRRTGTGRQVDPLFRSAALAYGQRVIARRSLGESLDDGSAGMAAVKERGGVTIAQSPEERLLPVDAA